MEDTKTRPVDAAGNPIYRVPEANLDGLRARVEKLNKRARKLNLREIVITETGEEFVPHVEEERDIHGIVHTTETLDRFVLLTVVGETPRVNGWDFAATIQHDENGNILAVSPRFEKDLPLRFRSAETLCDHCRTNRRRTDTYVLYSQETDTWRQVGRNCLADFLRTTKPEALAEFAELLRDLESDLDGGYDSDDFGGGGGKAYYGTQRLLAQVAVCVRLDGWCSRTEARNSLDGKQATVDQALCFFDSKARQAMRPEYLESHRSTDADKALAGAAIQWAQELDPEVGNDYLWNIRVISHKEQIDYRQAGLAGSIISAYNRHLERELARKYEASLTLNEHFGTIKENGDFTLTITGYRTFDGSYGVSHMYRFRDAEGRTAVWFASKAQSHLQTPEEAQEGVYAKDWAIGDTVRVIGLVQGHEDYRGTKQTKLTRVVLWTPELAAHLAKKAAAAARKAAKLAKLAQGNAA